MAGTGTVDFRGTVGAVGGVGEKVASAKRAHASVFLAPEGEAGDARAAAGGGITVVPVRTFDDALAALARS